MGVRSAAGFTHPPRRSRVGPQPGRHNGRRQCLGADVGGSRQRARLRAHGLRQSDFYGGKRLGDNRFANSLLALDANTGQLRWHQQLIHHDLWDYDLGAQPALVEMERRGAPMPAVIQATKSGMVFVFERDTGKPVFGMREQMVPQSTVPGEVAVADAAVLSACLRSSSSARSARTTRGASRFWDRAQCRRLIRKSPQ